MKGLGLELDSPDVVAGDLSTRHVARLVGDQASYAYARDWRYLLDFVPDQGGTSTCVSWYLSTATYLAGAISGTPIPRPSVRWINAISHWIDHPRTAISPGGRSVRRAADAGEIHGLVAEARWPFDESRVTEPPAFDNDVAGSDALLTGCYTMGGGDLPTQMRVSLDQGHIPGVAIQVRQSFDDYKSGLYAPAGTFRGWHMIACVGYRPDGFCFLRNWGPYDGDGGFMWIPDDVLLTPDVADAIVVTAAPPGVR